MEKSIVYPHTISLIITRKCSAACLNCCFKCSPKETAEISEKDAYTFINEALQSFSTIKVLVITGGECTLNMDKLCRIISYGKKQGLVVRVVTNAHWARSIGEAKKIVDRLKKPELDEINYSTGDEHQKFVPENNIVNAIFAANWANLFCAVNVEYKRDALYTSTNLINNPQVKRILSDNSGGRLVIKNGLWVTFENAESLSYGESVLGDFNDGCDNLFTTISINPYSNLMACCGITAEYIPFLRLGSVEKRGQMSQLHENQFSDFLKIWIYCYGPHKVLSILKSDMKIPEKTQERRHPCVDCAELFLDRRYANYIAENMSKYAGDVLLEYDIKRRMLNKQKELI